MIENKKKRFLLGLVLLCSVSLTSFAEAAMTLKDYTTDDSISFDQHPQNTGDTQTFESAAEVDDLSLAQLLDLAVKHNATIGVAIERVNQALATVRGAGAEMGPSVIGGLGARWSKDDTALSYRNTYIAALSLIQTVYAGGSLVANKRAAEFTHEGVKEEGVRGYQKLMGTVRTNYYNVLRTHALHQVRVEALNLSREHLRQTEALFRRGLVPKGDALRVQVSVSQGEIDQLRSANDLEVSWRTLERNVGVPLARKDVIRPLSGDRVIELKPPRYTVPSDPIALALRQRPELRTYTYYKKRADELAKAAAGEYLPHVQLNAQTGKTDNSFFPADNDDWYVALNLQWTLIDSGRASSRVSLMKATARELLYQIDDLTAQVELEVSTAEQNLRSALFRYVVAQNQIAKAEEDYRGTMRRYGAQMSTNLDVLDSRMALTDSRTEYVNAIYDIAVAQANMIDAIGADVLPSHFFK